MRASNVNQVMFGKQALVPLSIVHETVVTPTNAWRVEAIIDVVTYKLQKDCVCIADWPLFKCIIRLVSIQQTVLFHFLLSLTRHLITVFCLKYMSISALLFIVRPLLEYQGIENMLHKAS